MIGLSKQDKHLRCLCFPIIDKNNNYTYIIQKLNKPKYLSNFSIIYAAIGAIDAAIVAIGCVILAY